MKLLITKFSLTNYFEIQFTTLGIMGAVMVFIIVVMAWLIYWQSNLEEGWSRTTKEKALSYNIRGLKTKKEFGMWWVNSRRSKDA